MLLTLINKYCSKEGLTREELIQLRENLCLHDINHEVKTNNQPTMNCDNKYPNLQEKGSITRR